MLSSLARARNVVMLCRRRDLFAEDGVRCEHSETRFAVAARFEKNKWLFSSDGTKPKALGDEEHFRTFQDVEEVILLHFFVQRDITPNINNRSPSTAGLMGNKKVHDIASVYASPAIMTPILRGISRS